MAFDLLLRTAAAHPAGNAIVQHRLSDNSYQLMRTAFLKLYLYFLCLNARVLVSKLRTELWGAGWNRI
jgi:hypothetical protein